MTVAIIDDEPPAVNLLTAYIQRTKSLVLQHTFTDPMDALGEYNRPVPPQLTLLDIDMPGMNGIDFARIIGSKTKIILTTSFREYGPEAFDLAVSDYLLKPFSFERFVEAVQKVSPVFPAVSPLADFFFVRTESRGKYLRVTIADIIFVESQDNLVYISGTGGIITGMHKLGDVQSWLPARQFCRVHHSFIVNLAEVYAVDHGQIHLKNGSIIPVGRQYKDRFMERLQQLLIGSHT
ncbi:LytR/AlgR family response regulator transcription factor [Mucilaginibacter gossypii]|uniref:DNA-binding response regulator, LytR/AlgR family n=1 Tax=Mucilaginibacter gossypii TaxID=551996 RepID=A0A1G8A470_9SPHI|nr:LytTR family DNA-binding domain-containing protein [Mucilaginibacter gossypii]SDH15739.1 DNA-binding response regulator, LytR/AlgR family [Mucilaginibacter gossypii]